MVVDLIITTIIDYLLYFRSKVYDFVKNESQTNTMKNCIAVSENLQKKYDFPEKFADTISWMWLYEPARKIIIEDSKM